MHTRRTTFLPARNPRTAHHKLPKDSRRSTWWTKLVATVGTVVLLTGAGLVAAQSASAHDPQLSVTSSCNTQTGTYTLDFTGAVQNVPGGQTATVTVTQMTPAGTTAVGVPTSLTNSASFAFTETVPGTTTTATTSLHFVWSDGTVRDISATATPAGDCTKPPAPPSKDASAAVTTTAASCGVPEQLELGAVADAVWGTASRTSGPGSYTVTATAVAGHAFADGTTTDTFTGTLAGPVGFQATNPGAPCYQPTLDASAAVTTTAASCAAPATLVLGSPVNAVWGTASRTSGPGGYSVIATAGTGHEFSDGTTTATFTGTLAGPIGFQNSNPDAPCYRPVEDASAAVTTAAASCGAPASLVLGEVVEAAWGTPSKTSGPGSYSVTATATPGHQFSDGQGSQTFSGTLAGAIGFQNSNPDAPCYRPVEDASAAVTTTAPTCASPGLLVLGSPVNASWKTPTATTGPGSYAVDADADAGHEFSDGTTVVHFSGTLAGPLGYQNDNIDAPCYQPVEDASAALTTTAPSCDAPAVLVLGAVQNASWGTPTAITGPASYSVVATAGPGHEFGDGTATETFAGSLGGAIGYQNANPEAPCYQPVKDASAVVTTVAASCAAPESLVLGAVVDADWGAPSRTTGPGAYSVEATAESGHEFVDGSSALELTGTLAGPIGYQSADAQAPCYQVPASLTGTATGRCSAGAAVIDYHVAVGNPDRVPLKGDVVRLVLSDGRNSTSLTLGTLVNGALDGQIPWPVEAWTHDVKAAVFEVNPTVTVPLSYPGDCAPTTSSNPPSPAPAATATPSAQGASLADTGSNVLLPLAVVVVLLLLGGAALLASRVTRLRRRP